MVVRSADVGILGEYLWRLFDGDTDPAGIEIEIEIKFRARER
jgi:hypothetical protein